MLTFGIAYSLLLILFGLCTEARRRGDGCVFAGGVGWLCHLTLHAAGVGLFGADCLDAGAAAGVLGAGAANRELGTDPHSWLEIATVA